MPLVPLIGGDAGYKSRTVSMQRRVNLYIETKPNPDKGPAGMYGTPGMTVIDEAGVGNNPVTIGGGEIRGATVLGNVAYVVVGTSLYIHDQTQPNAYAILKLNVIGTSTGRVGMSNNGTQVIIVDGSAGYIYNINTLAFTTIGAPFPNGATTVTFLNGYFIVEKAGTGQFWWSNIYDGTTWNALQFATAESDPDNLVAVSSDHGILYLLGQRTVELWGPSGTTTVFQRIGASGITWGLAAKWSFDRFGDDEIFLAQNRMGQFEVIRLSGFTATPVGTPDVIHDMNELFTTAQYNGLSPASQATAFSYMLDRHQFYQINFPTKSYLYDGTENTWQEVSSWNSGLGGRHYADLHYSISGMSFVSDYRGTAASGYAPTTANRAVYFLDVDAYTDERAIPAAEGFLPVVGEPILREWETKHVFADLERMTIIDFQIEMEAGVGLPSDVTFAIFNNGVAGVAVPVGAGSGGSNPQIMLNWSKDGGFTWGSEIWQPWGLIGGYLTRAVWRMLGRARDFVFRVRTTDPVKVVISNIAMNVQ